jgi:hypothetical protein
MNMMDYSDSDSDEEMDIHKEEGKEEGKGEEGNYEGEFLNYFQMEPENMRKNYDIIKNSERKHNVLNENSTKFLKIMKTFDYTMPSNNLQTVYLFNSMHGVLKIYYDEFLNEPYYEMLPCPINMWRLKPAPQHNACYAYNSDVSEVMKLQTPDDNDEDEDEDKEEDEKEKIEKYFKDIIDLGIFETNDDENMDMFEMKDKYLEKERNNIVYTKQKEFYINKKYGIGKNSNNGIFFCDDVVFELPIVFEGEYNEIYNKLLNTDNSLNKLNFGRLHEKYIMYKRGQDLIKFHRQFF